MPTTAIDVMLLQNETLKQLHEKMQVILAEQPTNLANVLIVATAIGLVAGTVTSYAAPGSK